MNGRLSAEDVSRSDVMRAVMRFGLEVFERRATAHVAETQADVRRSS